MAAREQIMTTLLAQLDGITANGVALKTSGRRLRDPENVPGTDRPALFLVEHLDNWDRTGINLPAKRTMTVWAIIYTDIGADENAIPMTQINYFIEAIEAALAPDAPSLNRFTLGGLVFNCMIEGGGIRAAGDTTGKSIAAVPISILLI
jgi:hypothetical protein